MVVFIIICIAVLVAAAVAVAVIVAKSSDRSGERVGKTRGYMPKGKAGELVVAACGSVPVLAVRKINPVSIIRARE